MGSSTSKGNISTLLLIVTLIVMLVAIGFLAELMVSDRVRAGKYVNPYVASQVVRGTIYDRNGRALAIEVPKNCVYIRPGAEDKDTISQILAVYTGKTPSEILALLNRRSDSPILVYSDLTTREATQLQEELDRNSIDSNDVQVVKEYSRVYPAAFHAAQLIDETESVFNHVLSPVPGFNETTTYGSDVYLTIDLDIQYLLDLAVQQVYEVQSPEYCVAFVLDIASGDTLAATTYPFYDLNDKTEIPEQQRISRTLVSSISLSNVRISEVKNVSKICIHDTETPAESFEKDKEYTSNLDVVRNMIRFSDGRTSILETIPEKESKYLLFIGSVNPKYHQGSSVMDYAVQSIEQGLVAQGKL